MTSQCYFVNIVNCVRVGGAQIWDKLSKLHRMGWASGKGGTVTDRVHTHEW